MRNVEDNNETALVVPLLHLLDLDDPNDGVAARPVPKLAREESRGRR
jgi:hypothetical protein